MSNQAEKTYTVGIIGAGPIGIELAVSLKRAGVDYIQLDANQIGHSMTWWPANTTFFSTTERLAIAGIPIQNNHQGRITGEAYLAYLRQIVEQFDLAVQVHEPVTEIKKDDGVFLLTSNPLTGPKQYRCQNIVFAIGDMMRPNKINIPGEELPHVSHYWESPHPYFRQRLLIVGGRNSAAEAALRCWRAGVQVTLSYRRPDFKNSRIKHWLLPDLEAQFEAGTIQFLPSTVPIKITPEHVLLQPTDADGQPLAEAEPIVHPTDFVFLATGYRGDHALLDMVGVERRGENCVPTFNPATMESNVPGVYLCGTVAAGIQRRYTLFIENCHEHAGKITAALAGKWPTKLGTVPARNYHLRFEQYQDN